MSKTPGLQILQTIEEMLAADKDWNFNQFCVDAINGKRERIRQYLKNKRRYEDEKRIRLELKMKTASLEQPVKFE